MTLKCFFITHFLLLNGKYSRVSYFGVIASKDLEFQIVYPFVANAHDIEISDNQVENIVT